MNMKMLVRVFTLFCCATLIASQVLVSVEGQAGQKTGYTVTDEDDDEGIGHNVFSINLDTAVATEMALSGVPQELEGLFSLDVDTDGTPGPDRSRLFGVAETPDDTGTGDDSVLVDLTPAACSTDTEAELGELIGPTNIVFGTEAGAAWDPVTQTRYSIASDDRDRIDENGIDFPATRLYKLGANGAFTSIVNTTQGPNDLYLDGLACAPDGALYATDARFTDSLYIFDADADSDGDWVQVGEFNVSDGMGGALDFNEDTGLANWTGVGGGGTNLYMITEGEGAQDGRLWTINHTTGQATLVGVIRVGANGPVIPEDVEGFDIPNFPLACN
jgi:hypothetical protein